MEDKFKKSYCKKLIDHMSEGYSYETFGQKVDVVTATLYNWEKRHDEWAKAKNLAFQKAQEFFEKRLMSKVSGKGDGDLSAKDIDTSCLIFALKTRFHACYKEKSEVETRVSTIKIDSDDEGL